MLFEPKQVQSVMNLNVFTSQETRVLSNAELTSFWNCVLFTKQFDSTLRLLVKVSRSFFWHSTNSSSNSNRNIYNSYNVLKVSLHGRLLNIAPLFAPDLFADAFIVLIGFPCNILKWSLSILINQLFFNKSFTSFNKLKY